MDADSKPKTVASPLPDRPVSDRSSPQSEEPSEPAVADEWDQYAAELRAQQRADALASQEATGATEAPAGAAPGMVATATRATALGAVAASAARGNVAGVASSARNVYKFYTALGSLFTLAGTIPAFGYLNYYMLRSLMGSAKHPAGIVEKMIVGMIDGLVVAALLLVVANLFLVICFIQHPISVWWSGLEACF